MSILFWAVATGSIDLAETLLATDKVQLTCQAKIDQRCRLEMGLCASDSRLTSIRVTLYPNKYAFIDRCENAMFLLRVREYVLPWALQHGYELLLRHLFWHLVCLAGGIADAESHAVKPLHTDADLVALISQHPTVDLDCDDDKGRTILSYAAGYGLSGLVKSILEHTTDQLNKGDDFGRTPLYYAVDNCRADVVKMLLQKTKLINDPRKEHIPLHLSPRHKEVIELMLQYRVSFQDIRVDGEDLLTWTCSCGHESTLKLLLQHGDYNVNSRDPQGQTPLYIAAKYRCRSIVQLLLAYPDIEVNARAADGRTALHVSVSMRHESIVKLLLEREDVDVNARDHFNETPLFHTGSRDDDSTLKLLLEHEDVDVNARVHFNETPLFHTGSRDDDSTLKLLLEREDVDVNARNYRDETPLFNAARLDHKTTLKLLLERTDIQVNATSGGTGSPLCAAARHGSVKAVQVLLEQPDIDLDIVYEDMSYGKRFTALEIARRRGYTEVVEMLECKMHGRRAGSSL
ncbi:uncharacterized protein PV07_09186 [Cladophialophora immunda]|uniref:Uncharacterized protein n=1 Tax=Cladophialophora immunda TaxID=569365 RepID=A0A0D2ALW6_9EURO|nr:uncharacterized protein PV07_09186 [Cladophialophora immunda]KIW26057.1 hypothetical protein PV07_09186 [Cladophialophora immunda]